MYEGNILNLGTLPSWNDAAVEPDGLHVVSWSELVVRLRAARDFRHFLEESYEGAKGSFNHSSARRIADLAVRQRTINSFALTDGKTGESMCRRLSQDETTCD